MYTLPYSKTEITFDLLPSMKGTVVRSQSVPPLADVSDEINRALLRPINSAPLREIAKKEDSICIVFTDITRACPDLGQHPTDPARRRGCPPADIR